MTGFEVPLLIAGVGLQAYSTYQAGVDAKAQAEQQAAFAEYNAQVSKQQAEAQRMANQEASKQHARRTEMALSRMRARVGKSGVAMSGSPLLVMEDTANQFELERASMLARGESQARAFEQQSILDISRAEAFEESGQAAFETGVLGAAGQAIGGAATISAFESPLTKDYRLAKNMEY